MKLKEIYPLMGFGIKYILKISDREITPILTFERYEENNEYNKYSNCEINSIHVWNNDTLLIELKTLNLK